MKFSFYDYNTSPYQNVKANIMADRMSKNRWGNRFKSLYLKHNETIYGVPNCYSFKEGMRECTSADGTSEERISEYLDFLHALGEQEDGAWSITVQNISQYDEISTNYDIKIASKEYSVSNQNFPNDLDEYLEEIILEQGLFDFNTTLYDTMNIDLTLQSLKDYVNNEIFEIMFYTSDQARAMDDFKLIEHLGICDTLRSEIDRPNKIKTIYFTFIKKISPPKKYEDNIRVGWDESYNWWEEEQFQDLEEYVPNWRDLCTVHYGEVEDYGGWGGCSVSLSPNFLDQSGWKILFFVKCFINIEVRAKKNRFKQLFGVVLFVVGIFLSVTTANPAWLKILLVTTAIAQYSGNLSAEAQLALMVVMFAYGLYNTEFGAMSSMEMFKWGVGNIEMVYKMVALYNTVKQDPPKDESTYETQENAMNFIYSDAYSQYDNLYNVIYDFEPKYQ